MILPLEAHGVKVISMGFFVPEETPVIWRGPMLHKAIEQFLGDVYWGDLDFLLCDLPPGTGDVSISLASFIPGASMLVVTTPQEAARKVAERAGKMAERTNLRPIGVVENMSCYVCPHCGERETLFGEGGGRLAAETLGVPLARAGPPGSRAARGRRRGRARSSFRPVVPGVRGAPRGGRRDPEGDEVEDRQAALADGALTTTSDVLRAMFAHHLWATARLIDALEGLGPEPLDARIDGTLRVDDADAHAPRGRGRALPATPHHADGALEGGRRHPARLPTSARRCGSTAIDGPGCWTRSTAATSTRP